MTAKKPEPINKNTLIQSFFTGIVTLGLAWIGYQTHLADVSRSRMEESIKRVDETAKKIELQTDGVVTANLKTIAIAAENLAENTKDKVNAENNAKLAARAWEAYDDRVKQVERAELQRMEIEKTTIKKDNK